MERYSFSARGGKWSGFMARSCERERDGWIGMGGQHLARASSWTRRDRRPCERVQGKQSAA